VSGSVPELRAAGILNDTVEMCGGPASSTASHKEAKTSPESLHAGRIFSSVRFSAESQASSRFCLVIHPVPTNSSTSQRNSENRVAAGLV